MPEPSSGRRVLVTGGAGFIGSHLVRHLVGGGSSVTVIDDLSTGRRENLDDIDPRLLDLIVGTVGQELPRLKAVTPIDAVFHLAASVGVRLVVDEPIRCIETNVHETSTVLRHAAESGTPVLLASTSEVYGKSEDVPFAEDDDVVYGASTEPRWSYAYSKGIDEHLGLAWHQSGGLPVVVARLFNTVGPGQRGRWGMVLPRFIGRAIRGEPLLVHGDGLQSRCFCDVRDVAPLLARLLAEPRAEGMVVNVGWNEAISIADLARLVIQVLGSSSEIRFIAVEEDYGRSIEDMRRRIPDVTRLRDLTGFAPAISLDQTILDTAAAMTSGEHVG